jgi:endonuclease G
MQKVITFVLIFLSLFLFGCSKKSVKAPSIVETFCASSPLKLLPPSLPNCQNGEIVEHLAYTVCYDEEYEQANWVMYYLTADMVANKLVERTDDFRIDSEVDTESASPNDYKYSGFDRGHLVPAADMQWSSEAMSESFFMSNITPQTPNLNRGEWKILEEKVREWVTKNEGLYIIAGPIFDENPVTIGENEVAIPQNFFKVILDQTCPQIKAIGFIFANTTEREGSEGLTDNAVSVDIVENITGLNFFQNLPQNLQEEIEASVSF